MGLFNFLRKKKANTMSAQTPFTKLNKVNLPNSHKNLLSLVNNVYNEHFELLRKIENHKLCSEFSGIITLKAPNIKNSIQYLLDEDLVRISTPKEALNKFTIPQLKELLKQYNLKTTGKKQELLNALENELDYMEVINISKKNNFYIRTSKGNDILSNYLYQFKQYKIDIENRVLELIRTGSFNDAALFYDRQMKLKGMSNDNTSKWTSEFGDYLNPIQLKSYEDLLEKDYSLELKELIILCSILKNYTITDLINNLLPSLLNIYSLDEIKLICKTELRIIYINNELNELISAGFKYYYVITMFIPDVCDTCKNATDKKFDLNKAVIGINCPPFHKGCICDISPFNSKSRRVRNPFTKESEIVNGFSNYDDWYECEKYKHTSN